MKIFAHVVLFKQSKAEMIEQRKRMSKEKVPQKSLYGLKSKCVIVTLPADEEHKCDSFMMDNRCKLKEVSTNQSLFISIIS